MDLAALPSLKLVQSASYFYTDGKAVPTQAAIAEAGGFWPTLGADQIAEWVVAAIFESQYKLGAASETFRRCAFLDSTPSGRASASTATNHTMVGDLTIGILGYGHIGTRVAQRVAPLGSTVVATTRNGPFAPAPAPLKWLSDDNDRLFREADVVVVTVLGSVLSIVNATSLALMKEHALIIPVSAGPIAFDALEAALRARPALRAVIDVWPGGCWHFPNVSCGAPLGERCWPASASLAQLPNILPLPGMSMRDAAYWRFSAAAAASNLDALASGAPLAHVVRNASHAQ